MQKKPYNWVVLIGRFQCPHTAHMKIIDRGLLIADNVLIIVGSARRPRTPKNPWTEAERVDMIRASLPHSDAVSRVHFEYNIDTIYNDGAWAVRVQQLAAKHIQAGDKVALIGHRKTGDTSTFYLDMFPQWEEVDVPSIRPYLHATQIRQQYFDPNVNMEWLRGVVPDPVFRRLVEFRKTAEYDNIVAEKEFDENYQKPYASLPYPVSFNTVDAVVEQSSHVLLIKRKFNPGKGLWALPGGFLSVKTDSGLQAAMIRELREETGLKVPEPVLIGRIAKTKPFDHPDRSARGRIITQAYHICLPNKGPLPKVTGADDAEVAAWVPISELDPKDFFEDHFEIISYFINVPSQWSV